MNNIFQEIAAQRKDHAREAKILQRAEMLVRSYAKTGSMSIVMSNGARLTDRPIYAPDRTLYKSNIKSKALQMARLAQEELEKPLLYKRLT